MAHKPRSFRINEKKKQLIIFTNVDKSIAEAEAESRNLYLEQGYKLMFEDKKPPLTVEKMREELQKAGETAILEKFDEAYAKKTPTKKDANGNTIKINFKETGFAAACNIYNEWKRKNKKK